jgi:DNA-binding MarR family transcriptional regulator
MNTKLFFESNDLNRTTNYSSWTDQDYMDAAYPHDRGRKPKLHPCSIKGIVALYEAGYSQKDIGEMVGVSQATVSRILNNVKRKAQ